MLKGLGRGLTAEMRTGIAEENENELVSKSF